MTTVEMTGHHRVLSFYSNPFGVGNPITQNEFMVAESGIGDWHENRTLSGDCSAE